MGKNKQIKRLKKRIAKLEKTKTKVNEIGYMSSLYNQHDYNEYDED